MWRNPYSRSDKVRKSGKFSVLEKQYVDHEQFWEPQYSYGSCDKSLAICGACHGSGNGKSRNTIKTNSGYRYDNGTRKYFTTDEIVYDFYECGTCKGGEL